LAFSIHAIKEAYFNDYLLPKFFLKENWFIFRVLPRKSVSNAVSRNGMDFYCFIFIKSGQEILAMQNCTIEDLINNVLEYVVNK